MESSEEILHRAAREIQSYEGEEPRFMIVKPKKRFWECCFPVPNPGSYEVTIVRSPKLACVYWQWRLGGASLALLHLAHHLGIRRERAIVTMLRLGLWDAESDAAPIQWTLPWRKKRWKVWGPGLTKSLLDEGRHWT